MAKKLSEVILQYKVSQSDLNRVYQQTDRLRKQVQEIGGDASDSAKQLSALFDEVQGGVRRAAAIKGLTSEFSDMQDQIGGTNKAAFELIKTLNSLGATKSEIEGAVQEFNKLQEATGGG